MSTFDALDALQFCANWFQARLEEQRTRTRDALSNGITPPTASATAGSPFSQIYNQPRTSIHGSIPGNALLGERNSSNPNIINPTFKLDGEDLAPSSPLTLSDPFTSFAMAILQPPSSMILARRTSVSAESIAVDTEFDDPLPVYPKSLTSSRIRTSIMKNFIFRGLDEEQQQGQGDVGEYFYVVESGYLECYIRDEPLPPDWLQPASVVSLEPSILWSLDRITFRTIILKAAHRKRTMYEGFLSSERSKIADALISQVCEDGTPVVRQGEMGDTFFFVEDGEAIVTKKLPSGEEIQVAHLKKGDYFGELSLLRREPRAATVSALVRTDLSVPKLKVAALDASAFTRLLGPLREIMDRHAGLAYGPRR
ncbi:cyclic nucleotide-binding-like protein [Irpex lacteus]|nr:cyclic nucleotide-binding-like protein [Irpex lacteus]